MTAGDEASDHHWPSHGELSYLQIPALDVRRSAAFYQTLFGWQVDPPEPGFMLLGSTGKPVLIGQWITDRPAAPDAGVLLWLQVDRLDDTLDLVSGRGGQVLEPAFPDGDGTERWLATIRDPGGNLLGLVQRAPR